MTKALKRSASVLLMLIMLVSLIPSTVFAATKNGWSNEDGSWYYYKNGVMQTGWLKVGNYWYYFYGDGEMCNYPAEEVNGKVYVFNKKGQLVDYKTGWYSTIYFGYTYRFYLTKGGVAKYTGANAGWHKISDKWYYFTEAGFACIPVNESDSIHIDGKYYYFDKNGAMKANCWLSIDGDWYYLDKNGQPTTGWKQISNKWYYFDDDGSMATHHWVDENKDSYSYTRWYYLGSDGAMVVSKWVLSGSSWYYQNSAGYSVYGWLKLSGKWYYMDPSSDGACVMNGSKTINGKTYNFDKNGVCTNP